MRLVVLLDQPVADLLEVLSPLLILNDRLVYLEYIFAHGSILSQAGEYLNLSDK